MDKTVPLIYSQHLRCIARLLNNANQTAIFTYLFDEYLHLIRSGLSQPGINKPMTTIAENTGVYRGRIETELQALEKLKLIKLSGKTVYINDNFLYAIAHLLYSKESVEEKRQVCTAFRAHDIEALKKLGLTDTFDGLSHFKQMNGSILSQMKQSVANETTCSKRDNLSQIQQSVANTTHLLQMQHVFQPILEVFPTKTDFLNAFFTQNDANATQNEILAVADFIFDANATISWNDAEAKLSQMLHFFVSQMQQPCRKCDNSNKYIEEEIKKENTQRSALVTKEKDSDEFFDEDEEFFDLKKPLEVLELKSAKTVEDLSENSPRTPSLSFPMIPVGEIDRIISDTEYASQDSLKLFINEVWLSLSEYFEMDVEEGDDEIPDSFEIESQGFPFEDFQRNILEVAYEQVAGYLAQGFVEVGDRQIPVTFTEMFPAELIGQIFRWEKTALAHNETVLKISKTGIYDVTAKKVEKVSQPKTRAEKRQATKDSLRYMTKILEWEDKSMLTSMENIVKYCIHHFLIPEPTEDGSSRFVINKESPAITDEGALTKTAWRQLQELLKDYHISEQHFLSCLMGNPVPNQYEQLTIQPCMFYADGIRAFHKLRGELSAID